MANEEELSVRTPRSETTFAIYIEVQVEIVPDSDKAFFGGIDRGVPT